MKKKTIHSFFGVVDDPCVHQYVSFSSMTARLHTHSAVALIIPAAYHSVKANTSLLGDSLGMNNFRGLESSNNIWLDLDPAGLDGLLIISRGTAILLLGMYIAFLFFQVGAIASRRYRLLILAQLKTHNYIFTPTPPTDEELAAGKPPLPEPEDPSMNIVSAGLWWVTHTCSSTKCT